MSVELSIIICTHNRYDVLPDAITSIETQDDPSSFELIIVDNSSDIASQRKFLQAADITCRHQIILEAVPGLSRARNIGVKAAKGHLVAFMDDDAQATTRWATQIIRTMREYQNAGICGGPVRPIWPVSRPPWLHKWLEGFLTIVDRGPTVRELPESEWLAGTNIIFRRDLLLAAGLFNENLGRVGKLLLSNEELAVSTRIRSMGHGVVYNPEIEMFHRVHADRVNQAWMRRRVFWQVISDLFSHGPPDQILERDVDKILDFQMLLPAKERGLSGLFLDLESPDAFYAQTEALALLVRLIATDGRDWQEFLQTSTP